MPTQVASKTVVVTKESTKLTTEVKAMVLAGVKFEGATLATIVTLRSESKRLGYDVDASRQLLFLSIMAAHRGSDKLPEKASPEKVKEFRDAQRFEVSRLINMAFPPAEVANDMQKLIDHDLALNGQKHGRYGVRGMLALARKQITFADLQAGKKPAKRNVTPTTPTVVDLSVTALENAAAGLRSRFVKPEGLTPAACRAVFDLVFCDGTYETAADKAAKAAAKAAKAAAKKKK